MADAAMSAFPSSSGTEWDYTGKWLSDSPEADHAPGIDGPLISRWQGADDPSTTTGAHGRISSVETYPALLFSLRRTPPCHVLMRSSLRLGSNVAILSSRRPRLAPKPLKTHKCVFALRGGPQFHMT